MFIYHWRVHKLQILPRTSPCSHLSSNGYRSFLNDCHIPWKVHSMTLDCLNSSIVAMADWNGRYSDLSSSVILFILHMLAEYRYGKAKLYIVLKTHFWADGMMVIFTGTVSPEDDCTAATNSSLLSRFVPYRFGCCIIHTKCGDEGERIIIIWIV